MARNRQWVDTEDEQTGANRQTASLAGLAVALVLVVGGLFVVQALQRSGKIEDCLLSGRSNCDVILAEAR
jgi:cell division septal protein FtsQ